MAITNKFIKFATLTSDINGSYDTMTDDQLNDLTNNDYAYDGIGFASLAKTNIINGIFRQLTFVNKEFSDLVAESITSTATLTLDTSMDSGDYKNYIKETIQNISLDAVESSGSYALKASNSPTTPKFWVGTETQYNGITKEQSVVYIII